MSSIRLDKYLADLGIASRKELKAVIKARRVAVNGNLALNGDLKIDPGSDTVSIDGRELSYKKYRYFMMNKPEGVLSATEDNKQETVLDLLSDEHKRLGLFPVGRLDKDTTGLLLLTNDGEFSHRVISPKSEVTKRYYALTDGIPDEHDAKAFEKGIVLKDGLQCLPAKLEITGDNFCYVNVMEGKYHQVKRMLASVGKPVLKLKRLSIGELYLPDELPEGGYVELDDTQLNKII